MKKYVSLDNLKRFYTKLKETTLDTMEEIQANQTSGKIAGALAVKELNRNVGKVSDDYTNKQYSDIGKLLDYYIANGYLPNLNEKPLVPLLSGKNPNVLFSDDFGGSEYYQAWHVFDGKKDTLWMAGRRANQWAGYKFQTKKKVTKISLSPVKGGSFSVRANGFPKRFKLEKSDNGSSWETVDEFTNSGYSENEYVYNITSKPVAQYFRIFAYDNFGNEYTTLGELQFFGPEV